MARIELNNVCVDFPIYHSSMSFRTELIQRATGGLIRREGKKQRLTVRGLDQINLLIKEGDRLLATWTPGRSRVWETVEVGPVDWQAGQPLVLAAYGPAPPGELNGAVLDRVEMEWQ